MRLTLIVLICLIPLTANAGRWEELILSAVKAETKISSPFAPIPDEVKQLFELNTDECPDGNCPLLVKAEVEESTETKAKTKVTKRRSIQRRAPYGILNRFRNR